MTYSCGSTESDTMAPARFSRFFSWRGRRTIWMQSFILPFKITIVACKKSSRTKNFCETKSMKTKYLTWTGHVGYIIASDRNMEAMERVLLVVDMAETGMRCWFLNMVSVKFDMDGSCGAKGTLMWGSEAYSFINGKREELIRIQVWPCLATKV